MTTFNYVRGKELSLTSVMFSDLSNLKDSFCKFTRPGNEAFVFACRHEIAEGVVPGRVPFDCDRLKGNMKNVLAFVEKSRKRLAADQDMIKFLRRERTLYFARGVFSNYSFSKRSRDGTTGRFTSGAVSMEGARTRATLGSMEAVNQADDQE